MSQSFRDATEIEWRQRSCFNWSPLKRSKLHIINKLDSWKAECLEILFGPTKEER